jgi:arginyl-tRNA synthetase
MSDIQNELRNYIKEATLNVYKNEDFVKDIVVEIPRDPTIADYSTNVAMRLAKPLKSNPMMIAEKIVDELKKIAKGVDKIEIAKPGFINFKMSKTALADSINMIIDAGDKFGENNIGGGEKVNVEYVSANPTGDLHVGHARAAAWGDCITRLMNASGYKCLREYYINDAGRQIEMLGESLTSRYFEYYGKEYPLPTDGYHAQDIKDIAKMIAEKDGDKWLTADPKERITYFKDTGVDLELKKIEDDLKMFRVEFDSWIHERFFYENDDARIKACLDQMRKLNVLYEQDGALWLRTTDYGDDKDRVLVKKDGTFTYFLPDIANNMYKFERGCPKLIILLGADHHGYVARMNAALAALGHPFGSLVIDLEQMVRIIEDGKEVKMSKRTGNGVSLRELCEDVGVDAARYIFASRELGAHMDFDLTLVRKKTSDNPVYYAQYAYARAHRILIEAKSFEKAAKYDLLTDPKEVDILKTLNEFPNIVGDAAKTRAPNKICNYIQKLASYFHSYYGTCKINDPSNKELSNERLGLVEATSITLKNALNLIGVSAPDKM